jgi:hypothetical protein
MANSTFTVKVNVTDGGDVEKIKKALAGLGATVEKTRGSTNGANKSTKDFFDTQNKGIIGTANSTKSFSKLAETLGGSSSGLVGAYATLAANVFALSAAFNALRGAAQVDQIFRGLEASGSRTGRALTVAAAGLRDITGAAISTEQALRSTAQISSAGFGNDTIKRLGQAAKDTSFALGRNLTDSLDRLSRGIVKLEPELLDELGIMTKLTESNTLYAAKLGKSETQLTNFEKRQGFLNAVLTEAELKFGGLSDAAGDSTAYDKLSASFTDLTNSTLNLANTALKPLAAIFAGSSTALLGTAILFASGISKQLLPGLANLTKKGLEAADASRVLAKAKKDEAIAALAAAKAERASSIEPSRNAISSVKGGPKAFNDLTDSMKDGTATTVQRDRAQAALNKSIDTHINQLGKLTDANKIAAKFDILERLGGQLNALETLKKAELDYQTASVAGNDKLRRANQEALKARLSSSAQIAGADAIGLASQGNLVKSFSRLIDATRYFSQSQTETGRSGVTAMNAIKTAGFGAALGIRAIGAAFLNFIPVIGQIVLVAGLLKTAYEYFKSDAVKRSEQAYETFEEVLKSTDKTIQDLTRTQSSQASASLRAQQAIISQSNAINTLVDAYKDLLTAANAVSKATDTKKTGISGFGDLANANLLNGDFGRARASNKLGVDVGSRARQLFQDQTTGNLTADPKIVAAAQLFEKIDKLAPEATDQILKFYGGFNQIMKLPIEKRQTAITALALAVQKRYGDAAEAVTGFAENLKNLDQQLGEFFLGAIPKTAYDDVVKGFNSVTDSIVNFQSVANKNGTQDGAKWEQILTGLGGNVSKYLAESTRNDVKSAQTADTKVQALKQQEALQGSLNKESQDELKYQQSVLATFNARLPAVVADLEKAEQRYEVAQRLERSIKSQVTLEQAVLQANSANLSGSAKGLEVRLRTENRIKDLQKSQLQAQKAILDSTLAQNRADIERLKTLLGVNAAMTIQQALAEQADAASKKRQLEDALVADNKNPLAVLQNVIRGNVAKLYGNFANDSAYREANARLEAANKTVETVTRLKGLNRETEQMGAAAEALGKEIQAISVTQLSNGQIQAQVGEERLKLLNEQSAKLAVQVSTYEEMVKLERSSARLASGRSEALRDQLDDIRASAVVQRRLSDDERKRALTAIAAQRAVAVSDQSAASSAELRAANADRLNNLDLQARVEQSSYNVAQARISVEERNNLLQKAAFDTQKEGLEWQKSSYDYALKRLDAAKELSDTLEEQVSLQIKLTQKRTGLGESAGSNNAATIRVAAESYRLAVDQASVQKSVIRLEYALLDAQRSQLVEELRARREILARESAPGAVAAVAQLDRSLANLESVDTSAIADSLIKNIDAALANKRLSVEVALQPDFDSTNNPILKALSAIQGRALEAQARKAATATMEAAQKVSTAEKPYAAPSNRTEVSKAYEPVTTSLDNLRESINKLIAALPNISKIPLVSGGLNSLQDAAKYGQSQGARISEMAGYGPIGKHATHSAHYSGNAFDLNMAPGRGEVNDPVISARMDKLAAYYESQGFKVLWKVAGHFDHMHVQFTDRVDRMATKVETSVTKIADVASNDIVVSGKLHKDVPKVVEAGSKPIDFASVSAPSAGVDALATKQVQNLTPLKDTLNTFNTLAENTKQQLSELGPQGAVLTSVIDGMNTLGTAGISAMEIFNSSTSSLTDKFAAGAAVAQAAIGTIQGVLSNAAAAKEEAIQREIDAESRRDGKSAESVAKLAALDKKKDEIARKTFNTNKKLQMASAVIGTAAGVAQALGSGLPFPANVILAGVIGAMGAAQLAIISGTSYQSTSASTAAPQAPTTLTVGKRGDTVDLARQNNNVGGELGYLRGAQGQGSNSSNYATIGSAYGGPVPRGYGNASYMVGEKGPEPIVPAVPLSVQSNNSPASTPTVISPTFQIHAIDSKSMVQVLTEQRGNIISMLREAANASGQPFMENVDVNAYTSPKVSKL